MKTYSIYSDRITHARLVRFVAASGLAVAMGAGIGGCKNQPTREPISSSEPVNTGLSKIDQNDGLGLPRQSDLINEDGQFGVVSDQIAESARQLEVYFANMEIDGVESVDPNDTQQLLLPSETQAIGSTEEPTPTDQQPVSATGTATQEPRDDDGGIRVSLLSGGDGAAQSDAGEQVGEVVASDSLAQANAIDPEERKEALAQELAEILRSMAAASDDPGSAALALAGLELLLPTDTAKLVDDGVLSQAEQISLEAARTFFRSLSNDGSIASPEAIANGLKEVQSQLGAWAGMQITKSALCTHVDGFGRYETFPTYRFVAGKAQQAIVYVELERFGQREFVGTDGQPRYETKLSQRLELYHVADDLNTWNRAAETVTDVSRNHLRDYYLINQITLPANLGVGRYHLKVVMRDLVGDTVAESIIPIEVVLR